MSKYPTLSPYCFVGNSPLKFIDPDGKEIIIAAPPGSKEYLRISDALEQVKISNPKLYQSVHGSPTKVYISLESLNPTQVVDQSPGPSGATTVFDSRPPTVTTRDAGVTTTSFSHNNRVKGVTNVQKDKEGNPMDAQVQAQYSSDEIEKYDKEHQDDPNAQGGWQQTRAYTDQEVADQGLVGINQITIKLDPGLTKKEFKRTVAHELGHANYSLTNVVKAYIWSILADPAKKGHDKYNPSGKAAKDAETPEPKEAAPAQK